MMVKVRVKRSISTDGVRVPEGVRLEAKKVDHNGLTMYYVAGLHAVKMGVYGRSANTYLGFYLSENEVEVLDEKPS